MTVYNPKEVEERVQKFWEERKIPEKIVKFDHSKPKFYLLDGPPYVNNVPHVGHIKTTTFKDIWGKFKFMQGYAVWFQPGFDCSGLPIENAVEKKLGIKTKKEWLSRGNDLSRRTFLWLSVPCPVCLTATFLACLMLSRLTRISNLRIGFWWA